MEIRNYTPGYHRVIYVHGSHSIRARGNEKQVHVSGLDDITNLSWAVDVPKKLQTPGSELNELLEENNWFF